jgi:Protein of unknown function (DUF3168)
MSDALFNAQGAVMAALAASAEVQSVLGNPPSIYDHVPPGALFPYAVFGPLHVSPYDTKAESGFEQIVTIDIYSRYRGGKEARDIFQAVYDTLHRANLSVSGEVFISCEFHAATFVVEGDGLTTHAMAQFTLITQNS